VADAVRLGTQLGVDEAVLLGALAHGSAASRALAGAVARGAVAVFTEAVGGFLGQDLEGAADGAAALGAGLGAPGRPITCPAPPPPPNARAVAVTDRRPPRPDSPSSTGPSPSCTRALATTGPARTACR